MDEKRQEAFRQLLVNPDSAGRWMDPPAGGVPARRTWLTDYHAYLATSYGGADFAGVMDADKQTPMALASIFVPELFSEEDLNERVGEDKFEAVLEQDGVEELEDLLVAFDPQAHTPREVNGGAVIIGPPGSGKSALVRVLAASCAAGPRNRWNTRFGRRLVLPFVLRELDLRGVKTTDGLITRWMERVAHQGEKFAGVIQKEHLLFYLEQGWAIIAFDGVDEVGRIRRRQVWRLAHAFRGRFPRCALLITGRPVGFQDRRLEAAFPARWWQAVRKREARPGVELGVERPGVELPEAPPRLQRRYLRPFNQGQIAEYITRWFQERYPHDQAHQNQEKALLGEAMANYSALAQIKRRPIFLAILTYVHDVKGKLPNSQVLAYEAMVEAYLDTLDARKRLRDQELKAVSHTFDQLDRWRVLETLAHRLHTKAMGAPIGDKESPFHLRFTAQEFTQWLAEWIEKDNCPLRFAREQENHQAHIPTLLAFFTARAGLLVEPEKDVFQFSHLSFQEFLVGSWLFRRLGHFIFDPLKLLKPELLDKLSSSLEWHPVGLAFFGLQSQKQGGSFQEELLKKTWLDDKQDAKLEANRLRFLDRLLTEGEHTISATFRETLWAHYWDRTVETVRDVHLWDNPWITAWEVCGDHWEQWHAKEWCLKRFQSLPREHPHEELWLFTFLPQPWLAQQWQALGENGIQERWHTALEKDRALRWSLDLHALHPPVAAVTTTLFTRTEHHLLLDIFPPPLSLVTQWHENKGYHNAITLDWTGMILSHQPAHGPTRALAWARARALARDRARALALARDRARALALDRTRALARDRARALALARDRARALALDRTRARARARVLDRTRALALDLDLDLDLARALARDRVLALALARDLDRDLDRDRALARALARALDRALLEFVVAWNMAHAYCHSTPRYIATPARALAAMEAQAQAEKDPGFRELFAEDWFPYKYLQALAEKSPPPEPLEAMSHRFYALLRHVLEQAGEKTDDLPATLTLNPGDIHRRWHGEAAAEAYLQELTEAGWRPEDDGWDPAGDEPWQPREVDRWVHEYVNEILESV